MKMTQKVSVIIPCYNAESNIGTTLQSLIVEKEWIREIICVDDGSTDQTVKTIEDFSSAHPSPPITTIKQANAGACAARNNGMSQAKEEWLAFIDADDTISPGRFKADFEALANSTSDFLIGSYHSIDETGEEIRVYLQDPETDLWITMMRSELGITSANLWKKSAIESVGSWNETLRSSQEYDLMYRMLTSGLCATRSSHIKTNYLVHSSSLTFKNRADNWNRYVDLRIKIWNHLNEAGTLNMAPYTQELFDAIRMWAQHDLDSATACFKENIPSGFTPQVTNTTSSKYIRLFKLFGFKRSEKLLRALR